MNYIDLSHSFVDNMPVFPGDPAASLKQITTIEKNGYTDHQLTTVMHVGTHMDAPLHMIAGGKYMDEMPVSKCAGPGVLLNAYKLPVIDVNLLHGVTTPPGSVLLVYTGMSDLYGTDAYNTQYPLMTEAFANAAVTRGVSIIGLDYINPDKEETYPIHKIFLSHEILIVENLTNLGMLLNCPSFDVFAFPVKLHAEAAPVRVVARVG